MNNGANFFLGANTPEGFCSLFDELYDPRRGDRLYIIKGGPGTGKSTMMKHIAKRCGEAGAECEKVWCSSDPQSLDGLIFEGLGISIADGTSPHAIEPKFPGACETLIDLGRFWDADILRRNKERIIALSTECTNMHRRSVRFLCAADSLRRDTVRLSSAAVSAEKLERYASRLTSRKFGTPKGNIGIEKRRFLSAVTPDGVFNHTDTLKALCDDIYVIEDSYSAAAPKLLSLLRRYALGNGLDVISCANIFDPYGDPVGLIVPETGTGFVTSSADNRVTVSGATKIRASRFLDSSVIAEHKCRISFNEKTERELLEEAVESLKKAREIHGELEEIYKNAMDFDAVGEASERIADEIIRKR